MRRTVTVHIGYRLLVCFSLCSPPSQLIYCCVHRLLSAQLWAKMLLLECNVSLHRFCRNSIPRISPYYFVHNVHVYSRRLLPFNQPANQPTSQHQSSTIMKHEMWQTLRNSAQTQIHFTSTATKNVHCFMSRGEYSIRFVEEPRKNTKRFLSALIDKLRITFLFDLNHVYLIHSDGSFGKNLLVRAFANVVYLSTQSTFVGIGFHNHPQFIRVETKYEMSLAMLTKRRHPMKQDDIDIKAT